MNEERRGSEQEIQKTILKDIVDQVKFFYEHVVIFFTKQDFSDDVFNTMCIIRKALQENRSARDIMGLIVDFHLTWLRSTKAIEEFRNNIESTSRDTFQDLVLYTKRAVICRLQYFHRYLDTYRSTLANNEQFILRADVEIIGNMHDDVMQKLNDCLLWLQDSRDKRELKTKINIWIDELLHFIDNIYDKLSTDLIRIFKPSLANILKKDFQEVFGKFVCSTQHPITTERLEDLKCQGVSVQEILCYMVSHDCEIDKIIMKLNALDAQLTVNDEQEEENAAVFRSILQTTKDYLENRLTYLEETKTSIEKLNQDALLKLQDSNDCLCKGFYQLRIFSHVLPHNVRHSLVTKLCTTWNSVFTDQPHESYVSIYVEPNQRQEFTDEMGTFFIDEYSRKIYTLPGKNTPYQLNEHNKFVSLSDDNEHIYFYDDCGRYYFHSTTKQRIYTALGSKSEYTMDHEGDLRKIREERDGVVYQFDSYGRYYINEQGKQIYREADATSEYENDGFGNIVRLPNILDNSETCPQKANITLECKYLKEAVGSALRKCIVDAVLLQPADPIKYIAAALIQYRNNLEIRDNKEIDKKELMIEREIRMQEDATVMRGIEKDISLGASEASYDSNVEKYQHGTRSTSNI